MQLRLNSNETFKICQLTDIHLGASPLIGKSQQTLAALGKFLSVNSFNLIMITGDLIWGKLVKDPQAVLYKLYDLLNKFEVPVAVTYGNHDTEGKFNRQNLRNLESHLIFPADKHHSFITADRENYTLEVFRDNGELAHLIYVWDSGSYSKWQNKEEYAAIEPEQIEWFNHLPYKRAASSIDLGFLHIPLKEYQLATEKIIQGKKKEKICSPVTNSGLFYSLARKQNVKAIFAGHDHDNNFIGEYRGIKLGYGNITGYNAYGTLPRGVRVIELMNDCFKTETQLFE
ncbi:MULTISPECIES: metallophosphoesterase [Liquorilactobacillus]|uniref:Metallophosphoesterase n=1 Tax=Liquorilactobacillus nagelii TaxID=82688 RepID=A0A3Q8D0B9_9LACO|nr:metallophosphoesterase [Liquorilactobacillus nagelii]AUJ31993.1 metallophosphoesterase [Liquorilactobacillus nagelii]MCC7615138.1 metallophosphoesterase [Liquorilactobacillus nagelii]MCP9314801.1 metallophosphoesterase [Liquorilactobacillus nagelii]